MKNQMYRHLQQMSHAFFTSERQGDIITRMNTDVSGVSNVISGTLSNILSNVATVITTLIAMFGMNVKMHILVGENVLIHRTKMADEEVEPTYHPICHRLSIAPIQTYR